MSYRWDEARQRYRDARGRYVSSSTVRAELDTFLERVHQRTRGITQRLIDQRLSLSDWQLTMAQEIKTTHLAAGIVGRGGLAQMTQADYGRIGHILRDEYDHLRQWAIDLESGKAPLDGRALSRADLYQEGARGTYEEVSRYAARDAGLLFEISVLDPAAMHCNSCEDNAAMGVQQVGVLDRIGERDCMNRCKCELQQFATREEAEVA